jgi:hypothetical protein
MKVNYPMSNSKLPINYDVIMPSGVKPFNPKTDKVTEPIALSAMYNLYWSGLKQRSFKPMIDEILPLIDQGSLFPLPRSYNDRTPETSTQPKKVIEFARRELYYSVRIMAGKYFQSCMFYDNSDIRKKFPEVFEKIRSVQLESCAKLNYCFKHPKLQPHLEKVMFEIHDRLVKLQEEIPLFIASGQDPRLLVATQEEIDFHEMYHFTYRDQDAMMIAKMFVEGDFTRSYNQYKDIYGDDPLYQEGIDGLKEAVAKHKALASKFLLAKAHPVEEGVVTAKELNELENAYYDFEEIWDIGFPENFKGFVLHQSSNLNFDTLIQSYLETIASWIDLYYCYFYVSDMSNLLGYDKPVYWFKFRDKFEHNWRKPLKMMKSLVELFNYEKSLFRGNCSICHPFFEYLFDPKLSDYQDIRPFDNIITNILTQKDRLGTAEFTNMQTMMEPYNFIEEYAYPIAIKAQGEFGQEQIPSKTPYWNMETGEFTRTAIGSGERCKIGTSFHEFGMVFQSITSRPLRTRKRPIRPLTEAEQRISASIIQDLTDEEERLKDPIAWEKKQVEMQRKYQEIIDKMSKFFPNFGQTKTPPAKPILKKK